MTEWSRTGEFLFCDGKEVAHFADWRIAEMAALAFRLDAERREVDADNERLRLTLATVAVFIEGTAIANAVVVPEGASVHDKNLLSLIDTVNAALGNQQQTDPKP